MKLFNLEFIGDDTKEFLAEKDVKKSILNGGNVSAFSGKAGNAISLIFSEKEIILFSMLQWLAISFVYYIWVQMLGWIPVEVWESDSKIYDIPLNAALLLWSFFCVALAAYPIAILTGAMGAAHFLREQGYQSTIAACLKLAIPNSTKLWMFHTADGWLTVDMILERLPKKNNPTSPEKRALKEAFYYAWKVGTIGMPAALLTGKGLIEAGKDSILLVKNNLWEVLALRGGYSVICWVIGIAAYIASIFFFANFPSLFESDHFLFTFYLWMGVPIIIAVGVIKLFVRPIFVLASCQLYSDYIKEQGEQVEFKDLPGKGVSTFVAFLVLCIIMSFVFMYRQEIGLMNILNTSPGV